jgi:uncharacterized protein YjgD (DUF1641 family)
MEKQTAEKQTAALPASRKLSGQGEEFEQLAAAARGALTDQMVERLSSTGGNALEVLDRLNDEETRDAILTLIDELTALHRAGGIVKLFEMLHLFNALRHTLTDSMVERLAVFAEHTVNNLASEEILDFARDATEALDTAREVTARNPGKGGMMDTLRLLSQPETQESIRFLVAFAGRLQRPPS